jgi:tetratricopeptide (TPR) repeat protein
MRTPFTLLLLLTLTCLSRSLASDVETQFDAANKLYAQNKFAAAAAAYEGLTTNGVQSSVLYFNLGNAHFKAGQIGLAIAAYRQAEQLSPRDPDLRANLSFAQKRVAGPTIKPSGFERALRSLSLSEWTGLAALGVWLTFGLLIARIIKPTRTAGLKWWTWSSAAATVVLFALLGWAWTQHQPGRVAIVTTTEATVRSSPLDEAPSAFTVNDGAELRVLDHKGDWVQVTDDIRFGWLKRSAVHWSPRS